MVSAQYESILKAAHEEHAHEEGVPAIIRRLAELAIEREGSLKKAFAHWDRDGDKKLGREDLGATLQRLEIDLTPDELTELMKTLDVDGNGEVLYWEFVRILGEYANNEGKQKIGINRSTKAAVHSKEGASAATEDALPTKSVMLPAEVADDVMEEGEEEMQEDARVRPAC